MRASGEMLSHVGVAVEHGGAVLNSAGLVARHRYRYIYTFLSKKWPSGPTLYCVLCILHDIDII